MLLDTHSLLWLLGDDARLGPEARQHLTSATSVYSSPISMVEVSIKTMLGKLSVPAGYITAARSSGIKDLPFTDASGAALDRLPQLARHDPFDRMIAAQALAADLPLLTADHVLLGLGLPWIVSARR